MWVEDFSMWKSCASTGGGVWGILFSMEVNFLGVNSRGLRAWKVQGEAVFTFEQVRNFLRNIWVVFKKPLYKEKCNGWECATKIEQKVTMPGRKISHKAPD